MFVPTKLQRVNIFIPESDVEEAAVTIARFEKLHLNIRHEEGWRESSSQWNGLLDNYLGYKGRIDKLMSVLDVPSSPGPSPRRVEPSEQVNELDKTIGNAEDEILSWKEEMDDAESNIDHLGLLIQEVRLLLPLEMPVDEIRNPSYLSWSVGTMSRENLDRLKVVLFRVPVIIVPIKVEPERVLIVAAADREHGEFLSRATRGVFMEPVELPEGIKGIPKEVLPQLEERLKEQETRKEELLRQREEIRQNWMHRLQGLSQSVECNLRVSRAITSFDKHGNTYLINGWIPEKYSSELLVAIESATEGRADVELADPKTAGAAKTPTRMENPKILKPFESIVSIFGYPDYEESDPTPLVGLTFVLMYGMMFGDVGHGLIIAALGLLINRRGRGLARSVGSVLGAAGLSGAVFGFLYGSFFGREGIIDAVWLNPLGSIMDLLIASIIGGIILINAGFIMHLVTAVKKKNWSDFFLESSGLAGIALYWGLLGGGYGSIRGIIPGWLFFLSVFVPLLLLFFREPIVNVIRRKKPAVEEGWGSFSVQSFFELFETVISFVSNTLSFVRLGAFAVAHAGLMHVVFSLSETSGPLGRWIIIIIGSVIVIGLEGLIVGIQALRLEYYEFFGKFFSGGGKRFRPFSLCK